MENWKIEMFEITPENATKFSKNNKESINLFEVCSCYFCLERFNSNEITEWIDDGKTALCPKCGIDSILPSSQSIELLEKCNVKWFTRNASP